MENITTEEGTHAVADGTKLYTKTWKASGPVKARLAFVHGFSDHCNAYGVLFPTLASRGIEVHAFDQRGWGLSVRNPSEKGLTGPTSLVLSDIDSFLQSLLSTTPSSAAPLFLMGHSMGGAEILHYAAHGPISTRAHIRGYIAESPFIALDPATRPNKLTVVLGRLAGRLLPKRQMKNVIDAKLLSRDEAVQRAFVEDELCHDMGTLEGLAGMLDRAAQLELGKVRVSNAVGEGGQQASLWIGHGTKDGVCAYAPAKKWFDSLDVKDKEFRTYDGWFHKLHAEPAPDRETFANEVADWILKRAEGGSQPEAARPTSATAGQPKL